MISPIPNLRPFPRRAFSLVEVLLAIFILGIGLIMVASVFPVGANWTRQTTETSMGQNMGQNAIAVIQKHYGNGGDLQFYLAPDFLLSGGGPNPGNHNYILKQGTSPLTPFTLQALPGFVTDPSVPNSPGIPPSERAYQFGSNNPFPAANWANCTYFWTALARLSPAHRDPLGTIDGTNGIIPSASYSYDIFILVFRKGAAEQTFANLLPVNLPPTLPFEVPGTRDFSVNWGPNVLRVPSVVYAAWNGGQHDPNHTPTVFNAVPPVGQYGIGVFSGTVFRQSLDTSPGIILSVVAPGGAAAHPPLAVQSGVTEPVIFAPAANGADNSVTPLVYVYQTTLTF